MKKNITQLLTLCFTTLLLSFTTMQSQASVCDGTFTHNTTSNLDSIIFHHSGASVGYYHWSFGDGDTSNLQDPTHVFAAPGTYTVCLFIHQVPNNDTCSWCDTVVIPQPSSCNAQWTNYNNSNNPDSVHLLATESGALNYNWIFGDSTYGSGQYPWHVFPGPGTYTVCLVVTDSSGACTWCDTVIVPAPSGCTASFTDYSIGCDSMRFHASPTTAVGYYWAWGDNTNLSTTASNPGHTYPASGTYIACLTVYTSNDTCSFCDTVIVTCNSSCSAQWSNYNLSSNPDSVHFYPTGTGALGYSWTFGDSSGSTAQYPWHFYSAPGTYTVCLTAYYSTDTCTWCDTVIVPQPSSCNASFVHYVIGQDSIHFYPSSTNALSYYWSFGDNSSSTLLNPTHYYTAPGIYTVCLTIYYSNDSCRWCDTVVIAGSNSCNATWGNYSISNPDSIHFYANESGALGYFWTFGDSTTGTGQYPWHLFPGPGIYQVCLVVHDSSGYCTWCDTVIVPSPSGCTASFTHYSIGGDSVRFHPSPTTAIGYYWAWGDNTYLYSTSINPAHTYPGPGTYYACLTVYTSTDTCTHCDTVIVLGNTNPCNATFGHYNLSNPDSVHFYANESGALSYYWMFGDSTTGTGQYPWHLFPGPGTYNVCLVVHDSSGYCTWCDTVIVPGAPTCNAQFIHYPYGNNPDSMHFWPSSTNALGYYWSFGDNSYSTILNPTHVYSGPGTYNVCLTVFYSNDTCTWCDTVVIAGNPPCHAEFSHYTMSNPDSIHYYPTYTGATAWYWTFGDGNTSTLQYPWHYYATPGTYVVCLTAYYPTDTCTSCDSVVVGNSVCNTHFSHYTLNNPDSLHFYPTGSSAVSYHWDFGDGDTSNLQYPWHNYAASGTYYVCLTANYTSYSCTWCDSVTISVPPSCDAQFSYYFMNNADSLHFYPTATGALSYHWNFGDSTTSTLQYPWHLFATPGTYYVCLTAHYSSGYCTWCDYVTVGSQNVFYQVANNPLLDRFIFETTAVGIAEMHSTGTVSVYPNPANDILHIQRHDNTAADFILYDLNGRQIFNSRLKEADSVINISEISAGFYFYTLNSNNGISAKGKIIIVR